MKMLCIKRNLLENIAIISNCGTILSILLHYLTDISLLSGKWLLLYICAVFIASVFFSFRVIQCLLLLNKPISYDLDGFAEKYPYLAPLWRVLPQLPKQVKHEFKEYDTNELSVISNVLERKLVSSWYVPYISQEIGFPFACKQMLDQMIGKAFHICSNIDTKDVFVDTCTILTLHFKEYEKAIKRHEKLPSTPIEAYYKKSHPISNPASKYTSVEHCTNIVRIIIKELLPWELRDTPHSELLVRILSKKLDSYINSTIANPVWLNDKLLTYLTGEEYVEPKIEDNNPEIKQKVLQETILVAENLKNVNEQEVVMEIKEESPKNKLPAKTEMVVDEGRKTPEKDVKTSPILRQKRGRQGRNEVKIYDRIIEGSEKTWETDMDLQCISLGQDLLASLDGEITLSRLWGHEEAEGSPEHGGKSPHPWTAGEEFTDEEVPPPPSASPSPGDVLLKDLQETVSQAKHRIEDLQVKPLDSDEAAGMMEGLLDLGIAGLRKGLRFTGLGDDAQSPPQPRDRGDKSPPLEWGKRADDQGTAAERKEEVLNGVPQLVKQHRVSSQDEHRAPQPPPASESPEPQYEEAADLSTSIAKLRSLLRQRAEGSQPREGEVWWEGAEETRGRTQRHHSSRPVDTATLADEYDGTAERHSPNQASNNNNNNMQRLDKLFQRTVTGVFNSLKTAVGSDELAPPPATDWAYVHTNNELSVCVGAARLAWTRRARGVDAALDSLHVLPGGEGQGHGGEQGEGGAPPDDLEEWVCQQARAWSASAAVGGVLHSHVAHRLASLLLAEVVESIIARWLSSLAGWLRAQIFLQFSRMEGGETEGGGSCRPFDVEHTCDVICQRLTGANAVFGSATIRHRVQLVVRSCRTTAARDVAYRVLDSLVRHFKAAAQDRHPSFDNN